MLFTLARSATCGRGSERASVAVRGAQKSRVTAVLEFDAAANLIREDPFYVGGIDQSGDGDRWRDAD